VRTAAFDDPAQGELFERVEIAKIPDEITGLTLKTMLMDQGIEAELQDLQGSFYGSVLTSVQGYWGKLFVAKADESKARDIVRDFMGDTP
jgi:hypothetical protein